MHQGSGAGLTPRVVGETGGVSTVTLLASQVPAHNHTYNCGAGSKRETNTLAGQVNCGQPAGTTAIYATTTDGSVMPPRALQSLIPTVPHVHTHPYHFLCVIIPL